MMKIAPEPCCFDSSKSPLFVAAASDDEEEVDASECMAFQFFIPLSQQSNTGANDLSLPNFNCFGSFLNTFQFPGSSLMISCRNRPCHSHKWISRKSSCIVGSGRRLLQLLLLFVYEEQHPFMAAYVCRQRVSGEHHVRVIGGSIVPLLHPMIVVMAHLHRRRQHPLPPPFAEGQCEYLTLPPEIFHPKLRRSPRQWYPAPASLC